MNCGVVDIVADAFDCEGDDSDAGSNSNVTSSLVFVAVNVFERVEDFEFWEATFVCDSSIIVVVVFVVEVVAI